MPSCHGPLRQRCVRVSAPPCYYHPLPHAWVSYTVCCQSHLRIGGSSLMARWDMDMFSETHFLWNSSIVTFQRLTVNSSIVALQRLTIHHHPSPWQRLQLGILVVSLEDPSHVAALLGYSSSEDAPASLQDPSATLPRDLMRTLLANLRFHTVSPWECWLLRG